MFVECFRCWFLKGLFDGGYGVFDELGFVYFVFNIGNMKICVEKNDWVVNSVNNICDRVSEIFGRNRDIKFIWYFEIMIWVVVVLFFGKGY